MSWFTRNVTTGFKKFVQAFWDSLAYKWDDDELPWDAVSFDGWETPDPKNAFQASPKTWHTRLIKTFFE